MRIVRLIRRHAVLPLLTLVLLTIPCPAQTGVQGLDAFADSVMKEWKIPGLAVAAIKDGQVVVAKGYGFRDLEGKIPVTLRTVFAIGSNTKSLTATVMAMLNDDNKLDWDKPVREGGR